MSLPKGSVLSYVSDPRMKNFKLMGSSLQVETAWALPVGSTIGLMRCLLEKSRIKGTTQSPSASEVIHFVLSYLLEILSIHIKVLRMWGGVIVLICTIISTI